MKDYGSRQISVRKESLFYRRARILVLIFTGLAAGSCATGSGAIKSGENYRDPGGVYSVPAPRGLYNGHYTQGDRSVTFKDDGPAYYRIDYRTIDFSIAPGYAGLSQKEKLEKLAREWFTASILKTMRNSRVVGTESLVEDGHEMHLVVFEAPDGAIRKAGGGIGKAHWGILCFQLKDKIFMIHYRMSPLRLSPEPLTDQEIISGTRNGVLQFYRTIRFSAE